MDKSAANTVTREGLYVRVMVAADPRWEMVGQLRMECVGAESVPRTCSHREAEPAISGFHPYRSRCGNYAATFFTIAAPVAPEP